MGNNSGYAQRESKQDQRKSTDKSGMKSVGTALKVVGTLALIPVVWKLPSWLAERKMKDIWEEEE